MPLMDISHLFFTHAGEDRPLFEDLSLRLDTDWKLGVIGRNGRGKTTLLQLLAGRHPYAGRISAPTPFVVFAPDPPDPALPVAEAVRRLAPGHALPSWRWRRELALLGVPDAVAGELETRPFSSLSGGERTKTLLAALFARETGFPLIDEPTNHLDLPGRAALGRYLARKRGFVLVSHDRALLDACVDHVLALTANGVELQQGGYSAWKRNREYAEACARARRDKADRDAKRLADAARRSAGWSDATERTKFGHGPGALGTLDRGFIGHKAAKMMKRAKSLERRRQEAADMAAEAARQLQGSEEAAPLSLRPLSWGGGRVAEAADLTLWHQAGRPVCRGVHFALEPGRRLAVTGGNGSGKSTLLKLMAGLSPDQDGAFPCSWSGHVRRASGITVSYVAQDAAWLRGDAAAFARERGLDPQRFWAVLDRLGVGGKADRTLRRRDMRGFSDGQRKKVLLAAGLCARAHLYVWDEPLNFVDIESREQIEQLILECQPTMLFVEHDQAFVDRVATDRLEL